MPIKNIITVILSCCACACAPSRLVEPLHTNEKQINFAAGGALFDYQGNTIPMPLSSISAAYGLQENLSIYAGLHTTAAVYGVMHTELGFVNEIYKTPKQDIRFSITPSAHFMHDKWEHHFKFYPSLELNIYSHTFGPQKLIYTGMSNWFELATKRAHGEKQNNHWIPAFHAGYTYKPNSISYNVELKYIAPFHSNKDIVVEYTSPSDNGAVGIYGSIGWTFK